MKKVLIVGAGAQGGPCTSILPGEDNVSEIRLGDINFDIANKVAERINSKKVIPINLDAGKKEALTKASEGVDAIMNFTLIEFNDIIMEAAIASHAHYIDTACNTNFLEHWITGNDPKYHNESINIGRSALVGCGISPGIANVLTRLACDQLDQVEKILIRVGRGFGKASDEVVSEWKPEPSKHLGCSHSRTASVITLYIWQRQSSEYSYDQTCLRRLKCTK